MIKRAITLITVVIYLISVCTFPVGATEITDTTTSEDYIPSETITLHLSETERVNTMDLRELHQLIEDCETRKQAAHDMANSARTLGYAEDNPVIVLARQEWQQADEDLKYYQELYEVAKVNEHWNYLSKQHPEAATIWKYLSDYGYNDYVCAGILGNIMSEVGGNTLTLDVNASGNGYYGICQWNKAYKSKVWYSNLDKQLEFLTKSIKEEFDTYGYMYKSGFNYNSFKNLTDEKAAAKAFAYVYERCGSSTVSQRQVNATVAYNYFTS
jgi:hypothetical protein